MKSLLKHENKIHYMCIFIVTIILCIPLFKSDFDIYKDDGIQHICRLMGTYESVIEKQPFAVIMSNFCNGFGYSWNLFYSPFTAVVPLLFHFFTNSFVGCLKLFLVGMLFLSGLFMYQFVKQLTSDAKIGFIASLLYMTFPYHLTDLYMRNAVSEFTAFAFLPMVFLGLHQILNQKKEKNWYLVIGTVLLFLTHSITTFIAAIFCAFYVIACYKQLKHRKVVLKLLISGAIILLSTSFFWGPMLQQKQAISYEVFREGMMGSPQMLQDNTIQLKQLLFTEKGDICFEIGVITFLLLITAPFFYKNIKKDYRKEWLLFLIFGIISLLVTFSFFPWSHMPKIFGMIQFPWRFLEFAAFFLSITGAIQIGTILKNVKYVEILLLALILISLTMLTMKNQISYANNIDETKYYNGQPVLGNSQRVHAGLAKYEYLPTKANQDRDYIANRQDGIIVLQGSAEITNQDKQGSKMSFVVQNSTNGTIIELPYIAYLGYEARTENGQIMKLKESSKGFLEMELPACTNTKIQIQYTGTYLMKVTTVLSWGTIVLYSLFVFLDYRKEIR